jgi:WD40 repeat protein
MALRPEDRYRTVKELQADLLAWREQRTLPGIRYGALRLATRAVARHRQWLVGSVLVLAAAGTLVFSILASYVLVLTLARDRAVAAEQVAAGRTVDQQVALARMRAESGLTGQARAELLDATTRYEALGRDPITARLALSALDAEWPPPEVQLRGAVGAFALAPDADRVAVLAGRTVAVHDLLTGALVSRWTAPDGGEVRLQGWALGQPRVLLRDEDHLSRLDALGQPRWSVDLPPGSAPGVFVSADERFLVASDGSRSHVLSLPSGVVAATVEGSVTALSVDGVRAVRHLPLTSKHRQVTHYDLVDVASGAVLGGRDGIEGAVFSPDLSQLVVATGDGTRGLGWDGPPVWTGPPVKGSFVTQVPGGSEVLALGTDGVVQVLDAATGRVVALSRVGDGRTPGSDSAVFGHGWVASLVRGAVHVWSLAERPSAVGPGHRGAGMAVDVSPDGILTASSGWEGDVVLRDTRTWVELFRTTVSAEGVRGVAFSPDGSQLATGDREGFVHVLDLASGHLSEPLDAQHGIVMALDWTEDAGLVGAYEDGWLVRWDAVRGEVDQALHADLEAAWSLEVVGDAVAVSGRGEDDPLGERWDLASGTRAGVTGAWTTGYGVALAPDGTFAVGDGFGRAVETAGPKTLVYQEGAGGPVMSLRYSSDGRFLVAGTFGGTVTVYDRATRAEVFTLEQHLGAVHDLRFVPGTQRVVSVGGDPGTVATFDLDPSVEPILEVEAGQDVARPDLSAAAVRAELRGDWAHAARALETARAQGTAVSALRLAQSHLANGDRAACRAALPAAEDGVAATSLAVLARACAESR